jgi:hypothetical protein
MGAFFLLRINDHMQYLKKINATLEGRGDFRGGDHHSCKLGNWLDGTGPQEAAEAGPQAVALLEDIWRPHELFHLASGEALALQAAGRQEESKRASTEMHRLSSTLVDLLLGLDRVASGKA